MGMDLCAVNELAFYQISLVIYVKDPVANYSSWLLERKPGAKNKCTYNTMWAQVLP